MAGREKRPLTGAPTKADARGKAHRLFAAAPMALEITTAAALSPSLAPSAETLDTFVRASVILTGLTEVELWGTGLVPARYAWVQQHAGALIDKLLAAFPAGGAPDDQATKVLKDKDLGPLARQVMKFWYLGEWDSANGDAVIPSPASYREGLVWQVIGAHPQGAKAQGFGAWALPPIETSGG
jgi:hypothetical protein